VNLFYRIFIKIFGLIAYWSLPSVITVSLHRLRGVKLGKGVRIHRFVYIDDFCPNLITIEDNAGIGVGVKLIAHERDLREYGPSVGQHTLPFEQKNILIKEDSYVGVGAIVLPGVTIGKGAVIGAGAVVTKDIPDYSVAVGMPAKVIKTFEK